MRPYFQKGIYVLWQYILNVSVPCPRCLSHPPSQVPLVLFAHHCSSFTYSRGWLALILFFASKRWIGLVTWCDIREISQCSGKEPPTPTTRGIVPRASSLYRMQIDSPWGSKPILLITSLLLIVLIKVFKNST